MRSVINTILRYLYRDASNYKVFSEAIVAGKLDQGALQPFFHEGEFFVPSQVGLKDLQPSPFTKDDHIWHELASVAPTCEPATIPMGAIELLAGFRQASKNDWNQELVFAEKGLL